MGNINLGHTLMNLYRHDWAHVLCYIERESCPTSWQGVTQTALLQNVPPVMLTLAMASFCLSYSTRGFIISEHHIHLLAT